MSDPSFAPRIERAYVLTGVNRTDHQHTDQHRRSGAAETQMAGVILHLKSRLAIQR
jgi:hypothetical protein